MTIARYSSDPSRLRRRAADILISVGLIFVASGGAISVRMTPGAKDPAADDPLPRILEKTKEYCQRLSRASLDFVCRERIDEREYSPPLKLFSNQAMPGTRQVTSISLEYDYQLVRKGESIEEKRVLLRENKQPRNEPDAVLKTKLYKHKYLVYGPAGLLGEYWQSKHSYAYLGERNLDGEKAFLVEALPQGPPMPNLLYGKVWVRKKDFAVVRIEWDQRSLGNYDVILRMAKAVGHQAEPRISIVGRYGVEKNGIRFLDRLTIHEDYDSNRGVFRASETTVLYKDYKFFVVETEVRF